MPLTTLPNYWNRFDPTKGYEDLLFVASRALQSAEQNEVQSWITNRFTQVLGFVFKDGAVLSGTTPIVSPVDGLTVSVELPQTTVYIQGAVYRVNPVTLTVSNQGLVEIGVWLKTETVTADQDATLRDPAVGARNYNEVGAARLKRSPQWATEGTGSPFYQVYLINNGVIVDQTPPALSDTYLQILRRYDYESNGNYVVRGLEVRAMPGEDSGVTLYSVGAGVGNIQGYKIDKGTSTRLSYPADPDLQLVTTEPHNAQGATTRVQLNRFPVQAILNVVATFQRTVDVVRGIAGSSDPLPDVSVLNIQSVTQGATTFTQGVDFFLNGDRIDWSLAGAEPAPGSTYQVTYQFLGPTTPTALDLDAGQFTVTGVVPGSLILTDYRFKLPRIDRICMDKDGRLVRIKGISSRFKINPPTVPNTLLNLATCENTWVGLPTVQLDGVVALPFGEIQRMRRMIFDLYDLQARQALLGDIALRESATKRGLFVDPFRDDLQRDQGTTQTGAIVRGALRLPIDGWVHQTNQTGDIFLPYVTVAVVAVWQQTGSSKINPYQAFEPIPASVLLNPGVDNWVERRSVWTSPRTENFFEYIPGNLVPRGIAARSVIDTTTERVESTVDYSLISYLRQIPVNFTVSGFASGEVLNGLLFDSVPVGHNAPPANTSGTLQGTFTIPPNIFAGTKLVEFIGNQGSRGSAYFTGQGMIETTVMQQVNTVVTRQYDPLAQTFTLSEGRFITGVSLWFTAVGNRANKVIAEIRETQNGIPTRTTLVDGILAGSDIQIGNWNYIGFSRPQWVPPNVEYAIVILTDDPDHAVAICEVGRFDTSGVPVTAQPYSVGVLLKSSNASTWTPFQEADLTFALHAAEFTENSRTFDLGPIVQTLAETLTHSGGLATFTSQTPHRFSTGDRVLVSGASPTAYNGIHTVAVTSDHQFTFPLSGSPASATGNISAVLGEATDLIVLANVLRTSNQTDVVFTVTTPTQTYRLADNNGFQLPNLLDEPANLSVTLTGNRTQSPVLFAGTQVVYGRVAREGTYKSRYFDCPPSSNIRVLLDTLIPSPATVTVDAQTSSGNWIPIPQTAVDPLGESWNEVTYQTQTDATENSVIRLRLTLAGTPNSRPLVCNLRAMVT